MIALGAKHRPRQGTVTDLGLESGRRQFSAAFAHDLGQIIQATGQLAVQWRRQLVQPRIVPPDDNQPGACKNPPHQRRLPLAQATLQVLVLEQGLSHGALAAWLQQQVGDFDAKKLRPIEVAGWQGLQYPAARSPARQVDVYAASDGVRTVVVIAQGQTQILRLYDTEIEQIAAEIVSVPSY